MIEFSLATVIITAVLGLIGSSGFTAGLVWWLNRRKAASETAQSEAGSLELLLDKIKTLVSEKLDDVAKNQALQTEVASLRTVVTIRDAEISRQGQTIKDILIEQGRAHEREMRCQQNLAAIQQRLDEYDDLYRVNKRLVQDNLRMQGAIDETSNKDKTK